MKAVRHALRLAAAAAVALPFPVMAQAAATSLAATASPAASEMTEAEVRKVDRSNKKITLKHGAIKSLDMPPMTMVFGVADEKLLDRVQAGDKVRFTATGDGGKYTVTELQPANHAGQ